ncbi:MAG TPA: hypothetical protein VJR25_02400 [Microbacterium sp.]|uniref:hypothetical protein n=1 Tax=Microbacterium sp. TaxID=51671 RepID=UPI002B478A61|nr:hypothetical protein [Microbacterium sp.]HKT55598.1 hypothetical protein [Microbacterium sp.]
MASRATRSSSQSAADRRDFHLGVLISLGACLLLITLVCELTGQPALIWAVLTGAVAVIVAILWRRRSRR